MNSSNIIFTLFILLFCSHQIIAQGIPFEFHKISDIRNGYTLQSNGSPQQLWIDLNNPGYLHAIFMNSQFSEPPFADRTCLYFGSIDDGVTWFHPGPVPDTSRSGFPAISGTTDGAAIIVNHSDYFGSPTRTGLFIDESPFQYNFSAYDPGIQPPTGWPRCYRISDDKILIAATAQQSGDNIAFNTFDIPSSTFSGWILFPGISSETSFLSVSDGEKVGFAFITNEITNAGDVFYTESSDAGITWTIPLKIFDCPAEQGIAVGALRGISLNFYGESPCVVFETCQQDFNNGGYFPRQPNEILFWSPNVNGGAAKVIADSSNVQFAPSLNPEDVFPPLCRPVIGRTETQDLIFIAFSAATENVYVGTDSISYFAGYVMASENGGETWPWEPQKFTPEDPLLDWKYISGLSVFKVIQNFPIIFTLHYVLQADSLEESPDPNFLSAQYYHASFTNNPPSVNEDNNLKTFIIEQNYPNPFNPVTKIKYSIPSLSFVQIKVFDVLGNEIVTLLNEEKSVGSYNINFDGSNMPSGVYFYQLRAGNFIQAKKMVLMK